MQCPSNAVLRISWDMKPPAELPEDRRRAGYHQSGTAKECTPSIPGVAARFVKASAVALSIIQAARAGLNVRGRCCRSATTLLSHPNPRIFLMVWFYKRDRLSMSLETRFDNETSE